MSEASILPRLILDPALDPPPLRAGFVLATGMRPVAASSSASAFLADTLARVRASGEAFLAPERKAAVRSMLRHGKYKPAGRAKPSSEYLLAAALEGEAPLGGFPLVNGPVDANNAVSLAWGYPASIFDLDKSGPDLLIRRGRPGESYVFNRSGQEIELEDLLLVARKVEDASAEDGFRWEACGNPVKDAMATKVFEGCRGVVAVVFAPRGEPRADLEACCERFAALLGADCGAAEIGWRIVE
jgi:DNA/RNA-binding domain of Phe-tRNA-synthetase-like protein